MRIQRGDRPEAPPADIAARGLAPGYHVREMSEAEVDRFCRAWGVDANDAYVRQKIRACVVPRLKAVILPTGAGEDVREHEYAHTWDLQHKANGRGWVNRPDNPFAQRTAQTVPANPFRGR